MLTARPDRNLQIVVEAWVDALRREDLDAVGRRLHPDVVWQGVRPDLRCGNRREVLASLAGSLPERPAVDAIDLRAVGEDRVIFGLQSRELRSVADEPLHGEVYEVFTIADDTIVR